MACCGRPACGLTYSPTAIFPRTSRGIPNRSRIEGHLTMAKVCIVTGKKPMSGNNVSHANNKTRRRFEPNLHDKRFWVPSEKRWVKLRVSAKAIKIITKKGIERVLADLRKDGVKV